MLSERVSPSSENQPARSSRTTRTAVGRPLRNADQGSGSTGRPDMPIGCDGSPRSGPPAGTACLAHTVACPYVIRGVSPVRHAVVTALLAFLAAFVKHAADFTLSEAPISSQGPDRVERPVLCPKRHRLGAYGEHRRNLEGRQKLIFRFVHCVPSAVRQARSGGALAPLPIGPRRNGYAVKGSMHSSRSMSQSRSNIAHERDGLRITSV